MTDPPVDEPDAAQADAARAVMDLVRRLLASVYADERTPEPAEATVWVQYKGTNLCADFTCSCGATGHLDADFTYSVACGVCRQVWVLPQTLPLTRLEVADEETRRWHSDGVPVPMHDENGYPL